VFGKLDKFADRLRKTVEMFTVLQTYRRLRDSKIEGDLPELSMHVGGIADRMVRAFGVVCPCVCVSVCLFVRVLEGRCQHQSR